MDKIAIVGCGLVGSSWALVFARAGLRVSVYDPVPAAVDAALDYVQTSAKVLRDFGLLPDQTVHQIAALVTPAASIAEVMRGASYVQESAPESRELKSELYKNLGMLADQNTVLASSTSALPASSFTGDINARERVIVAHPINPPHLVPLVEIVPSPWTSPDVVRRTEALMRRVGQTPIMLNREIDGFVANRLQSAVLAEAFRLVADGICSVKEIDAAITDGLGLRWFFLGPFATIDLNAKGGVADYCSKLGPMYYRLAKSQADPRDWNKDLVAKVESQCREVTRADRLEARKEWRDVCLSEFVKAKRNILREHTDPASLR
jgi:L-gulonate 3-dehydrogenase